MRQLVLFFLFTAANVVCTPWSDCRSSEPKKPGAAASLLRSDSVAPTTLKALLGASFETTATEHFALLHEAGAAYTPKVGKTLEQAYVNFYEAFSEAGFDLSRSKDRLVWICFPQKSDFNQYAQQAEGMDLSWLDGYYSTLTNRVAMVQTDWPAPGHEEANPPLGNGMRVTLVASVQQSEEVLPMTAAGQRLDITRLTHELAHQLAFNSGIQKRGVMYPLWVSEGLATNFEFDWPADAGLDRCNTVRCACVLEMRVAGELVPLEQFVAQTKAPADTRMSRRHYAQAWAFFQFILTERPESLRTYLGRLAKQPPGPRDANTMLAEFTEAFGSLEAVEHSWNAFLDRQVQQALTGRPAASLPPDALAPRLP